MVPANRITVHPGEILQKEFLEPLSISMNALARAIRVPPNRISEIVAGDRSVSADTALRLARYFHTSDEFWVNLQAMHDLTRARAEHGETIAADVQPLAKSA